MPKLVSTQSLVEALALSAPWTLFAHFDELSHCIEASVCGVEILRRHGVKATCLPCSVIAWRNGEVVATGLSVETLERRFPNQGRLLDEPTFHCAIEVEEKMILDLTLGQICAHGVDVPPTFVTDCGFISQFKTPAGWRFSYERENWAHDKLKQFEDCNHVGLTEDLADLVRLVLKVGRDRFFEVLPHSISPPSAFEKAFQRIVALRRKGAPP
jgi:hypothetical protein